MWGMRWGQYRNHQKCVYIEANGKNSCKGTHSSGLWYGVHGVCVYSNSFSAQGGQVVNIRQAAKGAAPARGAGCGEEYRGGTEKEGAWQQRKVCAEMGHSKMGGRQAGGHTSCP